MRDRERVVGRWLWAGISLALACAGLALFFGRRDSAHSQAAFGAVSAAAGRPLRLLSSTNPPVNNQASTNQSESGSSEDRVVGLISEGNELLERNNYAEAADKFEQAVRIQPDDEDLHYNLAIALAKLGKTDEAKKQYAEVLRIFPEHADAHNNLGNLLMRENKPDEAIDQFREAIKILPENASFHNNLGTAFGRQRKVAEAMEEFREAIKLRPSYVEARVNLGNACLTAGQVDEAISQLNEALRLQPGFPPAVQAMQRAHQKQP